MKCPNCSSTDIIAIQGQHYCINCGQQVPDVEAKTTPTPPPEILEAIKGTPLKLAGAAENTATPDTKPVESEKSAQKSEKASPEPPQKPADEVSIPVNSAPKPEEPTPTPAVPPRVVDIKPVAKPTEPVDPPKPSATAIEQPETKPKAPSKPEKPPTSVDAKTAAGPLKDHPLRNAWRMLNSQFWLSAAVYAVLVAIAQLGLRLRLSPDYSQLVLNRFRLSQETPSSLNHLVALVSVGVGVSSALYLYRVYISAQISYRVAKQLDGRNASSEHSRQVALAALWPLVALDVITLLGLIIIGALGIWSAHVVGSLKLSTSVTQPLVLTIIYLLLIYLAFYVVMSRIMALRLMTLTARRFDQALIAAWGIVWHNTGELVLWGIEAVCFAFLLALPLSILGRVILDNHFSMSSPVGSILAVAGVGVLTYYLVIVFSLSFWSGIYHDFADRVSPTERQNLLTGRVPKPANGALVAAVLVWLVIVAGAAVGWHYQAHIGQAITPFVHRYF